MTKENPFDMITHTIKLELPRWMWDDLLEDRKQGHTIKDCIRSGLHQLHDLRLILEKDKEFKEIYEAHIEEWNARMREAMDAMNDIESPEYYEAIYEDQNDYGDYNHDYDFQF